jgi:hypothetical protein
VNEQLAVMVEVKKAQGVGDAQVVQLVRSDDLVTTPAGRQDSGSIDYGRRAIRAIY